MLAEANTMYLIFTWLFPESSNMVYYAKLIRDEIQNMSTEDYSPLDSMHDIVDSWNGLKLSMVGINQDLFSQLKPEAQNLVLRVMADFAASLRYGETRKLPSYYYTYTTGSDSDAIGVSATDCYDAMYQVACILASNGKQNELSSQHLHRLICDDVKED